MSRRIENIKELERRNVFQDTIIDNYYPNLPIVLPNLRLAEESSDDELKENLFGMYFDDIIVKTFKEIKDICLFQSKYSTDYFIEIDFLNFKYRISNTLKDSIEKCKDSERRFYILPIKLIFNYIDAHSNIIIIDNKKKTVEFLEPHGESIYANLPYNTETYVWQVINIIFLTHQINPRTYKFINVHKNCPRGLQVIQSESFPNSGFCLAWSLLFINIKLYNLDVDSNAIIEYLLNSFSPDDLNTYIKRFVGFVESKRKLDHRELKIEYHLSLSKNDKNTISNRIYNLAKKIHSSTITEDERSSINDELISYHNFPGYYEKYFQGINDFAYENLDPSLMSSFRNLDPFNISSL